MIILCWIISLALLCYIRCWYLVLLQYCHILCVPCWAECNLFWLENDIFLESSIMPFGLKMTRITNHVISAVEWSNVSHKFFFIKCLHPYPVFYLRSVLVISMNFPLNTARPKTILFIDVPQLTLFVLGLGISYTTCPF